MAAHAGGGGGNKPMGWFKWAVLFLVSVTFLAAIMISSGAMDVFMTRVLGWPAPGTSVQAIKPSGSELDKTGSGGILNGNNNHSFDELKPDSSDMQNLFGGINGMQNPGKTPVQDGQQTQQAQALRQRYTNALTMLDGMPIAAPHPQGYGRTLFADTWGPSLKPCGNATVRDDILARDMTNVQRNKQCKVTKGTLDDPYTGRTIQFTYGPGKNQSAAVQIDHVVAVKDAWESGAWQWTAKQRNQYYNDPLVLLAADGTQNEIKGDGLKLTGNNPVWLPANRKEHCDYVTRRVQIKHQYGLTSTTAEKAQETTILQQCAAD